MPSSIRTHHLFIYLSKKFPSSALGAGNYSRQAGNSLCLVKLRSAFCSKALWPHAVSVTYLWLCRKSHAYHMYLLPSLCLLRDEACLCHCNQVLGVELHITGAYQMLDEWMHTLLWRHTTRVVDFFLHLALRYLWFLPPKSASRGVLPCWATHLLCCWSHYQEK